MRWNCVHTFVLEAEDQADFDAKLARYSGLVERASERLDIGYGAGLMLGRADCGALPPPEPEPDQPLEVLFDD